MGYMDIGKGSFVTTGLSVECNYVVSLKIMRLGT